MHICRECGRVIHGPEFQDIFGGICCAWCYLRLAPPYDGIGPDPQFIKAQNYVNNHDRSGRLI